MAKKYSLTFWVLFWLISACLLFGWFLFLQYRNHSVTFLNYFVDVAPLSQEKQDDLHALIDLSEYVLQTNGQERTFLILFQNNMEIRPGGGFIGSFGILKVRDGHVTEFIAHDVSNFDGRIPSIVPPPYPMKETLRINSLKFRDSNYSPDFSENAKQAEYFYHLGDGREQFDGVVAITTNVLSSFLRMTGPVTVPGYPGEYTADNAVLGLEEQVEKSFVEQGIERGDRKAIMNPLAHEILRRVKGFDVTKKYELFKVVLEDLNRKDIQLFFKDEILQKRAAAAHWDGALDTAWKGDYLMVVDANMGAFKSDYYVKRSIDYMVDFSREKPHATLKITYNHTATEKNWLTKDYQSYVRVYVPHESWLTSSNNLSGEVKFGDDLGRKYFGALVQVPTGTEKTVVFEYDLSPNISNDFYTLKVQKQAGLNDIPLSVHVINPNQLRDDESFVLNRDFTWTAE